MSETIAQFVEDVGIWAALLVGVLIGLYRIATRLIARFAPMLQQLVDAHIGVVAAVGEANKLNAEMLRRVLETQAANSEQLGHVRRDVGELIRRMAPRDNEAST